MKRWVVFILVFLALLFPAWRLNGWIARIAAAQFDPYSTDSTAMSIGQIDRFWPPRNDPDWTRQPPERAEVTRRFGFTRWTISHTSGAELVIWAYEAGFPFRAFIGELRFDPMNKSRQIGLEQIEGPMFGDEPPSERWLPTTRLWLGSLLNTVIYAAAGWVVICGPVILLLRRRSAASAT